MVRGKIIKIVLRGIRTQQGNKHYALVTAPVDSGVQIIDITDPANPLPVAAVTDGVGGFEVLQTARGIVTQTRGNNHYALVAATNNAGVTIIDITDPANPSLVAALTDGAGGYTELRGAWEISTHTIGDSHYALVGAYLDDGVQIIDITDPTTPSPVAAVTDGVGGFTALEGVTGITTHTIGNSHYALTVARNDDGVQIIDITDPTMPSAVAALTDGVGGFNTLDSPRGITTHTIGNKHYALVAARFDYGVQIIDITDPLCRWPPPP